MEKIDFINYDTFDQMKAIKDFIKESKLNLFDEICIMGNDYRIFLNVSGKKAEEEYYSIWEKFYRADFTVTGMAYYREGTSAHKKPYMILDIDKDSNFFKKKMYQLSNNGKCKLQDGSLTLCKEMKEHLENTVDYPRICDSFKTKFIGPKLKEIRSDGVKLQFCPFCGEKISDSSADECEMCF